MATTMTAREAKDQLDALLERAGDGFDDIIVERDGEPRAVIVSFSDYQAIVELRRARRQEHVVAELDRLSAAVAAKNLDLTEEQIAEISVRAGREVLDAVIAKYENREPLKA